MHRGILVFSVLMAFVASPAGASALTLGSLDPESTDPGSGSLCVASQGNFIQGSVASGGPSYTVPQGGGNITSWSTRWGVSASDVALEVWRSDPMTSGEYTLIAKDSRTLAPDGNGVSTFATSISVQAGDVIGIAWPTANTITCSYNTTADADTVWGHGGTTYAPGSSADFSSFIVVRDRLNLTANLRQNADLALTQSVSRAKVAAGNSVNFLLTVRDYGPSPETATVTDKLPSGMTLYSAVAAGGFCSGTHTVTCLVSVGVGGSAPVSLTVIAHRPGRFVNRGRISSSATDPNSANNTAVAAVNVFSIPALGPISVKVKHQAVTFGFRLDQAARVKVVIDHHRTRTFSGHAGVNHVVMTHLGHGHHGAILTASTAAGKSRARTVSFRI